MSRREVIALIAALPTAKLGIKTGTAKQFVPRATDYLGKIGSDPLMNTLLGALR